VDTALLALITIAAMAACVLTGVMFYRDAPFLGVVGLAFSLFAGMIAMAYGVVAFA
jgi:hypothetical protein